MKSEPTPPRTNLKATVDLMSIFPLILRPEGATFQEVKSKLSPIKSTALIEKIHSFEALFGSKFSYENQVLKLKDDDLYRNLRPLQITYDERLALSFLAGKEMPYLSPDIRKSLKTLLDKLGLFTHDGTYDADQSLNLVYVSHLGKVRGKSEADARANFALIDELVDAIDNKTVCEVEYENREGKVMTHEIYPLKFFIKNGAPYLLVRTAYDGQRRSFRPAGILSVEQQPASFAPNPSDTEQGMNDFIDSSFGTYYGDAVSVVIWFSGEMYDYVGERVWATGQVLTERASDGSFELHFTASGQLEIRRWVMSFGKRARILSPQSMADEISLELEAAWLASKRPPLQTTNPA